MKINEEVIVYSVEQKEKIKIPVKIVKINFRHVTKSANRGLNTEYIVKNEELGIIGRGSKEDLAIENFKEKYQLKMRHK